MALTPGLAAVHAPLTDAFPRARTSRDRARFRLDDDELAELGERGFLADVPLLAPDEVAELRVRLDRLGAELDVLRPRLYEVESAWRDRPDEVVLHFLGAWLVDAWFHDLVFHPGVATPLGQALGADRLRFWHDQVFWKPPRHPGVVPWHQDYSFWTRTAPARHVTMYVTLDDMDEESGCLRYVPGSHRWDTLPAVSFGGDLDQLAEHLTAEQRDAFRPVPVEMAAGRASIHLAHTVHGSLANASDRPRRGVVLNFMGPDVRVADGARPLLEGTPAIPEGEVVRGTFFPLVDCSL